MSAVLRLVWLYFTGTTAARWLSGSGILLCLLSAYAVTALPQSQAMLALAMVGQLLFFLGSSLMPLTLGKLGQAGSARMLPGGRIKLLASAMLTVAIVALPIGLLTPFALVEGVGGDTSDLARQEVLDHAKMFALTVYTSGCILAGWLYVAMWFTSSQRDLMGIAKGALVVVILIFMPAREIRELSATTLWNLQQLAVVWTVFGAAFLAWPRLKQRFAGVRGPTLDSGSAAAESGRVSGREVALILGTSRPWVLAAGFVIPVFIASRAGETDATLWLFFLTIASISVAAISGQAAERSRALWLRSGASRAELFSQAERAMWRHNGPLIAFVVLLFLILGYRDYTVTFMALGVPMLVLATLSSSYLGLIMTRGLGWLEIVLGASVVLTLMWVALLAGVLKADIVTVTALQAVLAAATITFRAIAKHRWARLDWSQCRPVRLQPARGR